MHDLSTIRRLNLEAHEKAITDWRNDGKYVLAMYEGLTLVAAEPHDNVDSCISAGARAQCVVGTSLKLLPPVPEAQRISRHRDQSEDRQVNFATVEDYLRHTGQLAA